MPVAPVLPKAAQSKLAEKRISEFAVMRALQLLDGSREEIKESPRHRHTYEVLSTSQYAARDVTDAMVILATRVPDYYDLIVVHYGPGAERGTMKITVRAA